MEEDSFKDKNKTRWSNKMNYLSKLMFRVKPRKWDMKGHFYYKIALMTRKLIMVAKFLIWIFKILTNGLAFAKISLKYLNPGKEICYTINCYGMQKMTNMRDIQGGP